MPLSQPQRDIRSFLEGIDGAYNEVQRIISENPDAYFYPDQYSNNENRLAHYNGTGKEILSQTGGGITHFVSGTGTAGTFTGCVKPFPSEFDRTHALPVYSYIIMSVVKGKAVKTKSFVLSAEDMQFSEEKITICNKE